jgi:hypothetical protein
MTPTNSPQSKVRTSRELLALATLLIAAALASPALAVSARADSNPFEQLKGDWTGGGTVLPGKGGPKKVSCKVTYKVAGSTLSQNMSCTGDDYEIEAKLKLTDKAGKVKGSWTEAIYDASGAVTGTAKKNLIHAIIRGDKFSGRMSINVSDAGHSINIVQLNENTGTYRLVTSLRLRRQ